MTLPKLKLPQFDFRIGLIICRPMMEEYILSGHVSKNSNFFVAWRQQNLIL